MAVLRYVYITTSFSILGVKFVPLYIGQASTFHYFMLQRFESRILVNRDVQVLVEARDFKLEECHEAEEYKGLNQVAKPHRLFPDLYVKLVGHGLLLASSRPVEPLPQLIVLLEIQFVCHGQVI